MNVESGECGVHVVRMRAQTLGVGDTQGWSAIALVDFGVENYVSTPEVLAILDRPAMRRMRIQLDELLADD